MVFETWEEKTQKPFAFIKDHVLLQQATLLGAAVEVCRNKLTDEVVYTTKAEGKFQYKTENDKADFEYVSVAFSTNDPEIAWPLLG